MATLKEQIFYSREGTDNLLGEKSKFRISPVKNR